MLVLCLGLAPLGAASFAGAAQPRGIVGRSAVKMNVDPETKLWTPDDVLWTPPEKGGLRDEVHGAMTGKYCEDLAQVFRRKSRTVTAGPVKFGSEHPIVRQTMGTTSTKDVKGTIDQIMRCADVGFDLVRITVVGMKEANACHEIREGLFQKGYDIPICADMHFQPKVAIKTAEAVEKIRINPGNFADGRKQDEADVIYETDEDFLRDREYIVEAFAPLVETCKEYNRAMRIGTNHGSLSARILSFYGDSPRGMVESAIEFADICRAMDYHNFVFSMKASNPVVMIQGYRLLAAEMYRLGWDYPLHLGVTEAGEGEDGRMKSAIGIGTLLADGLGDTIRVSLTEDPEYEFQPCNRLAELAGGTLTPEAQKTQEAVPGYDDHRDVTLFTRQRGRLPEQREGDSLDYRGLLHRDGSVLTALPNAELTSVSAMGALGSSALFRAIGCKLIDTVSGESIPLKDVATSDALLLRKPPPESDTDSRATLATLAKAGIHAIVPSEALAATPLPGAVALVELADLDAKLLLRTGEDGGKGALGDSGRLAVTVRGDESDEQFGIMCAREAEIDMLLVESPSSLSRLHASRRLFSTLKGRNVELPVIHHLRVDDCPLSELALQLGIQAGALLGDGLGDGVLIESTDEETGGAFDLDYLRTTSFALLQGSRMRNTKTEFVSCPSCGRTLFDLQEVTAQISERTGHLPGVAIAIMGCIVNGPGEMADADFGYVGGAPGKVDLYVGKEVVQRGIPNEEACDALVQLIKDNGMWKEKEDDAPAVEVEAAVEEAVAA